MWVYVCGDECLKRKITNDIQVWIYDKTINYVSIETKKPIALFPKTLPEEFGLDKLVDSAYIEEYLDYE